MLKAYRLGKIISSVSEDYFQYQIEQNNNQESVLGLEQQSQLIQKKTEEFSTKFIAWLEKDFENKKAILERHPNPRNLFELCGAKLLVTSNSVTRSLSTKMGRLWEEIANISPYVIVPEFEFDIKITGVDIVILSEGTVYLAQLKTLKGTLTGSQKTRAEKELGIHNNPLFIAAFDLGQWTFSKNTQIPRLAGSEFWHKISMDYNLVENHVRSMLQRIDKAFSKLAASERQNME
ncbi:hypothetical protein [Coleofasciculus sp.]|uniref:hypothetical protein n=1 Tax=Coleofasciculus sp. TaxID=3100458 RepID=UPI0039FA56A6